MKMPVALFLTLLLIALGQPAPAAPEHQTAGSLDLARRLNEAFVEVAARASRSVVVINVVQKVPPPDADGEDDDSGSFENLPPGFWRNFHDQLKRGPQTSLGQGSGVIVRENGYILTNRHVVEDADTIQVRLQDGRRFPATVRGVDPQSDIAVLKVDARGLPVATLADSSSVRVGEFAIAIGAPFSLDFSVTVGHVSAKDRSNVLEGFEGMSMDQEYLQTDALINPGSSGGPLVNLEGQVIGINTLIRGLHTGIGFAIPSSLAREVGDALIADGKFTRAWLGIGIQAFRDSPELRDIIKDIDDGVVVSRIMPDGPAAKSDLRPSDIIIAVDGRPVATPQQLRTAIRTKKIGAPVNLDVFRHGKRALVKVSPGEWKEPTVVAHKPTSDTTPKTEPAELGITVEALTAELAARFGADSPEGVVVSTVAKDSAAARKGVKPGDIITSVNQQPTDTPKQFLSALKKADLKKGVILSLVSGRVARFEVLKASP